ncbi:hypothetical protein DFH08DRAFT_912616 [Mycena albidolilacea]|uniref:Uncharacterized protein n=1 Tax=Mycena albidolilacea TaxID=1033008 RepID=A0AAD7EXR5_9AGAR|nr:hypothetical protein DFH08DRAFT_912616 [Mycena albidolilacea]
MPKASSTLSTRVQSESEDALLAMTDMYMPQIVSKRKTYEFRRYHISPSVKRIWFYLNAPHSSVRYICDIEPARTRKFDDSDAPLPEDGLGNKEFNTFHADWDKYDFAYRILAVREIPLGISLKVMKDRYGMKAAPRGLVYVPSAMTKDFPLREQKFLWAVEEETLEIRDSVGEDSN